MTQPLFRLDALSFAYDPGRPVLRDLDFALYPGERVALCGPNGAGKTTLFQLMVGLLRPTAGTVEAFGKLRQTEPDFHEVRGRAGILFQDSDDQLFCPTVMEDVAFGPLNQGKRPAQARAIALHILDALGLAGFENRVTHKLSGGQKRLVALATVLAMEPEVLLLDEPTNALDAATERRLTEILLALPQAMVIISHDEAFLGRLATRRVCLDGGGLWGVKSAVRSPSGVTSMHGSHDGNHHSHEHKHGHVHEHSHVHTHDHCHGGEVHSHAHAHTHAHDHLHQHQHPHAHGEEADHSHDDAKHRWKPHEHQHPADELSDHEHQH